MNYSNRLLLIWRTFLVDFFLAAAAITLSLSINRADGADHVSGLSQNEIVDRALRYQLIFTCKDEVTGKITHPLALSEEVVRTRLLYSNCGVEKPKL